MGGAMMQPSKNRAHWGIVLLSCVFALARANSESHEGGSHAIQCHNGTYYGVLVNNHDVYVYCMPKENAEHHGHSSGPQVSSLVNAHDEAECEKLCHHECTAYEFGFPAPETCKLHFVAVAEGDAAADTKC